ncbi:MAG: signal recognition particle protein [Pseudomonadota bacterium]|nr:signal recognition particle protein [Pseudomonadota bacterium]
MFNQLGERLKETFRDLRGKGRLSEENISQALREVRVALLEADVALPVVKSFIDGVRGRAIGEEVVRSLTPGQTVIKIVHDELVNLMGVRNDVLNLAARPPAVILLAGLQGAGKTTTAAKLARFLKERENKRVLLASVDIYRPAAMEQLQRLAEEIEVPYRGDGKDAVAIAVDALSHSRSQVMDALIIDTAGRLHVDDDMMAEIQQIHQAVTPVETLFVVDSMTGQDAVNSARAFNEALALTGIILTKTDGDARGGAALSIREVTGRPIKFMGTGEGTGALEPFHPDRVASRILGMGDVLSLVEEVERKVDKEQAQKIARKLTRGKGFDFEDFKEQLLQMEQMGGLAGLVDKLPGMGELSPQIKSQIGSAETRRTLAIINSMTAKERAFPALIKGSRRRRIATGSGTEVQHVNRLLKQFSQMQKMMKKAKGKGGLARMMGQMKGNAAGLPPFSR